MLGDHPFATYDEIVTYVFDVLEGEVVNPDISPEKSEFRSKFDEFKKLKTDLEYLEKLISSHQKVALEIQMKMVACLEWGKTYYDDDEYDKIIYIDPDSVMCNACPDFFEEYDLGCVQNNTVCGPEYGGTKDEDYVNAGLVVCSSKKVWQRILEDYEKRNNKEWSTLNHQNALNLIYHSISNSKLLEFSDRSYGISSLAHYQDIELRQRGDIMLSEPQYELWLPSNKKLCVFHAAGVYWKTGNKVNYDYIKNEDARNLLISYTHA